MKSRTNNNDHIHVISEDVMNDSDRLSPNVDDLLNGNVGGATGCGNGNIEDISSGIGESIVPSVKRNKRAYSTHIEREKSDEKNIKLLRKNAVLRTLSPLLMASTVAIGKRSQSICAASSTTAPAQGPAKTSGDGKAVRASKANGSNSNHVNNNKIEPQASNYVTLRLRKR